jgi:hypothetical protein
VIDVDPHVAGSLPAILSVLFQAEAKELLYGWRDVG